MKKITALLCSIFFLIACQTPMPSTKDKLPFNPAIKHGKLSNGLQYFILKNDDPKQRVYIRLVVNTGSMHEDDDQKGIAHLVEHMAFNGSKKFPENQIINALEKLGMKFARDINAFTDFENTVYTLNLDDNNQQKLTLAFEVVNEWMNNLTILSKDLDGERGVVQEEWRRRLSPMLRLADKKSAIEMAGSRYLLRDPIGDMNIIRHISRDRVADFYHKWYRPDNMLVIIVGDIEPKNVLALLKQNLDTPNQITQTPLEKIDFSIPLIEQWRVASVSEQGTRIPSLELSFFENAQNNNTLNGYKQDLIQQIVTRLINLRLQKWEESQQKYIDSANFYRSHLGKETMQNIFSLQLFETDYLHSAKALFAFIAEIQQHGFNQTELDGEVKYLKRLNEKQLSIRQGSLKLADELMITAANDQVSVSMKDRHKLNNRFLEEITLSDINSAFRNMLDLKAKLLLVTQPVPEKSLPFNKTEIEKLWHATIVDEKQPQWLSEKHAENLPHLALQKGDLKQEKYWKKGDIYEFRLSNGSKLIYHYSDKTPNQVHFRAVTQGGLRSIPSENYHLLNTAISLVDDTGIGELSLSEINRLFAQNPLALVTVIDDDKQGFSGVAKSDDVENLLTLFRLKLQSAPISTQVLEKYRRETVEYFKQMDLETKFMQSVSRLRYPTAETVYTPNQKQQLAFTQAQLTEAYDRHILAKTDFTYFIIGDIGIEEAKALAKQYLASVEVKTQPRPYHPLHITTPTTPFVMHGLKEPRTDVEIHLTAENQWQPEQYYLLEILSDIVQEKLRLTLREKASGIYSVNSWFSQEPNTPQIEGKIEFSCDPQRADELLRLTHQILDDIVQNGVDEQLLRKKITEQHTQIKHQFDSLVSVASMIEDSYWQQNDPQAVYLYQQLDNLVNKQDIEALARKVLNKTGRFEAILRP